MTQNHFKEAMSLLASGVSVLTCRDRDENYGITISSLSSVGLNPPTVLVCVEGKSSMIGAIRRSRTFGITILREDQEHLGIRFAGAHLTAAERFKGTSYEIINGCPLLRDGLAEMSCVLEHEVSLSENTVFFGRVNYIEAHPGKPLVYFHRQWRHLTKNKQEEDSKAQ